jgi:hypothetical protein
MNFTTAQLGSMALDAAIDLERVQKSTLTDLSGIRAFVAALQDTSARDILQDDVLFPYYSMALSSSGASSGDSASFADWLAAVMPETERPTSDPEQIENLKNFCLSFHKAMILARRGVSSRQGRYGRI